MHSESGDHLLMGCAFSWNVWKCIADDLGIKIEAQQILDSSIIGG